MSKTSRDEKLHIDVMDGVFVPNISYGMPVVKTMAATRALMDKFNALQEEQNTMPLSAFNKLISEETAMDFHRCLILCAFNRSHKASLCSLGTGPILFHLLCVRCACSYGASLISHCAFPLAPSSVNVYSPFFTSSGSTTLIAT